MNTTPTERLAGPAGLRVTWLGMEYPAEAVCGGAAFELFSRQEAAGFIRVGRPDAPAPWHRYVPAADVTAVHGPAPEPTEAPLTAPLSRARGWPDIHRQAQSAVHRHDPAVHAIRATAVIRRGTRMVKVLSRVQLAGHLAGWQPYGLCYRAHDVAHLRTPADLHLLRTDGAAEPDDVAYVLRWRAVDPVDYEIPMGAVQAGLPGLPAHGRVGPPILGTGFTPSAHELIPEFVTAQLGDLPLTVNAHLVAYLPDGEEVILYAYQPEQHGWLRLAGPRRRDLLIGIPGINPEQEYVPSPAATRSAHLVGWVGDQEYEAVADPPEEFRIRARSRAARFPVQALARRWYAALWDSVPCVVLRNEGEWVRVRLSAPDAEAVARLAVQCYERGVYEAWAPAAALTDHRVVDVEYRL